MERSETLGKVWQLGEALVKELQDESHSVDALSRWMAHYIAEQMMLAEQSTDGEREEARERCFETILKLWSNRQSFPYDGRPLQSFDPVFRALERLDPENQAQSYFLEIEGPLKVNKQDDNDAELNVEDKELTADGVARWLEMAGKADRCARTIVDVAIKAAAAEASDEKTREWLRMASPFAGDDIRLVIRLMNFRTGGEGENEEAEIIAAQRRNIESKLLALDEFAVVQVAVRERLESELALLDGVSPA